MGRVLRGRVRPVRSEGLIPARVAARHHGPCELLTARGRLGGVPAGKLDEDELPVVGDWVAVRPLDGERKAVIEAVLPRRTAFTRKEAWRRTVEQVVAANVDTMFLTTAFGADLNPRRIERYLTSTWDSGADPVLVVNKLDEAVDPAAELAAVEAVALGVPGARDQRGRPARGSTRSTPTSDAGRTVALVGSSGVGKTTLVNRLLGGGRQATGDDERGRAGPPHDDPPRPVPAARRRRSCSTRRACASCRCGRTRRRWTARSRRSPRSPPPAASATARTTASRAARSRDGARRRLAHRGALRLLAQAAARAAGARAAPRRPRAGGGEAPVQADDPRAAGGTTNLSVPGRLGTSLAWRVNAPGREERDVRAGAGSRRELARADVIVRGGAAADAVHPARRREDEGAVGVADRARPSRWSSPSRSTACRSGRAPTPPSRARCSASSRSCGSSSTPSGSST